MGIVEPIALGVIVILIAAGIIRGVRGLGAMWRFKSVCAWVKKIDSIQIKDFIVPPRILISPYHYEKRDKDRELRENLTKGNNCLILGVPGMGKTRAAFEALKALGSKEPKELKGFLVAKLDRGVDKLLNTPLPKGFLCNRLKIVVFMDDLEGFLGSPGSNQIPRIMDKFTKEAKNPIFLATLKSIWKEVVKTHEPSAYYGFKEINLNEEKLTAKQAGIIAGKKIDLEFFRGTPATSVPDIQIMRQAYEKMPMEMHKIMWAMKIMDFALVNVTRNRLFLIYENLFKASREKFPSGLESLHSCGLIYLKDEQVKSDEIYLIGVVYDYPLRAEDLWLNLRTAAQIFYDEKDCEPLIDIAGRSYYTGRFQLCADANELALQLDPNDATGLNNKGAALNGLGRYEEAIQCFDKALELTDFKDPEAWNNKGAALAGLGRLENKPERFQEAIECYDKALELRKNYPQALYNKGNALDELKRYEDAIQCYDKALELRKDYPDALVNKGAAFHNFGQLEKKPELFHKAIECYDKALELRKDYPEAWNNKGAALAGLGRVEKKPELFHEAIEYYDKVLELRKDFPEAWNNKGNALTGLGRLENRSELFHKAIGCFDKALELTDFKDPEAWNNKGNALDELKRYEEAIQCFDKALELRKDFPEAWYNKGNALAALGRYQEAIQCYDKALELRPDYPEAWNNKGNALAVLKRYEEAIKCFDEALELTDFKDPEALNNKGLALAGPGRYEEAIDCYDKALKLRKDYPEAWNNKGTALAGLGRLEKKPELFHKAIDCYDKALELRKDLPQALNNKGAALAGLGRVEKKPELFQEAIECYDKALELRKEYPTAWYNKACAFALLGQKDDMLKALKEAVRLDPKNKEKAQKDEDFRAYWEDEDFKAIVK